MTSPRYLDHKIYQFCSNQTDIGFVGNQFLSKQIICCSPLHFEPQTSSSSLSDSLHSFSLTLGNTDLLNSVNMVRSQQYKFMLWQIRYGLCVGSHIVPPPCGAALSTDDAAHHQSPSRLQCKTVFVWKLREVSKKFYSVDVKILVFTYYMSLKKGKDGQDHLKRNWICPAGNGNMTPQK